MRIFATPAMIVAALCAPVAACAAEVGAEKTVVQEKQQEDAPKAETPFGSFSATLTAVTDYRDRGISQSDERPALQGSIDWEHDSGFYLGIWASNIDYNDAANARLELDYYAGYKTKLPNDFDIDLSVMETTYPGVPGSYDYNLYELTGALGHDFGPASAKLSFTWSPDNFADSGTETYTQLSAEAPLLETGFTLNGALGYQTVEIESRGGPDAVDWSAGIGYSWQGLDLGLKYIDTNLSKNTCPDGCAATVVFSIAHTFGGED